MKLNIVKTEFWQIRLQKLFFSIFTSLIVLFCANLSIATDNLLKNGGAESGNSDWQEWGYFTAVSSGYDGKSAHGGSKFFYGGDDNDKSALYQDIDVSEYENVIDNPFSGWMTENPVKATLSGYLGSHADSERMVLRMEFLDSSGKIKGDTEISESTTNWTYAERENFRVPYDTRTIRVKMRSYRQHGSNNNGYFDDLSLILYIPTSGSSGSWTGNKIQNPGAENENGLDNWHHPTLKSVSSPFSYSRNSDYFTKSDHSGSRFWTPGSEYIYAGAYQDVDVLDYAEAIDGGGVKAFLNGYVSSRYGDADKTRFRMLYLDTSNNELESESTGYHSWSSWHKYELEEYLPTGTRTVRVTMEAWEKYGYGALLDGSFDVLSLILALPELSKVNVPDKFDFGNLYLETETNPSLVDYNQSVIETISFKNSGDDDSKLNWSLNFSRADTDNLITDPGAENSTSSDLNGWENDDTAFTVRWSPSGSHSGNKYFYGGDSNADSHAYQNIDVSSYASEIDAGNVTATYSGGIRDYDGSDKGILELYFYDASMNDLGYHHSGWHSHVDWKRYAIEDKSLPAGTRTVRVRMKAERHSGSNNDGYFDDLRLTLKWTLCQGEAKFSESSGSLDKDATQTVTTWLEGFSGNPGDRSGLVVLSTGRGYAEIDVSAEAWRITQISHNSPEKGSNDKVNVALNDSVSLVLNSTTTHPPDATVVYRWQKRSAGEDPGTGFDQTDGVEKYYSFTDPGGYTIYCKAVEKIGTKEIESDLLEIPVRAWNRPVVKDTPPQANIDTGDVSWFNGKYAGVKSQPVRLMADGSTQNSDQNETITKYLWSFDPDWDTVELEQPAGEVVSYTWNNPKDDKIRCKAVTNYEVESEEKLFNLKVYDTLQVNPGGPYNGRVNTSITLEGSLENSYPGATIKYQWRVNSATPEGEIKNNATHQGDYIELTQAVDDQNGQIEYVDLPLSDDWSVTGEFWTGGGDGADAFYIYVWANATPTSEAQDRGQYSIIFNEYTDEIQLYSAPNPDMLKTVSQPIPIDNSEWRPFRVVFYKGEFEVYLDHQLKLEYDDSANYETRMNTQANNLFGFGARTGGLNNYHRVRNMEWTTGDLVDTTTQGEAEHTWTAEGSYLAGLTARVSTSEGLVLEDTEFAEVRIEAGVPTAMPGGPYRGGISGGNYSPVPFEGNHPDFVEADDVGVIEDWVWSFSDGSNGALELDGQDDHVIVNWMGDFPTTEITAEFWMKSSDDARAGTPMSYASSQHDNDFLIYDYKNFALYIVGVSTGATGVSANDGKWHHIALTWKSSDGELKFYKDGVVEYTKTIAKEGLFASGGAFVLGQEQDGVGSGFDRDQAFAGIIDDVRIWNVVRSEDAIRENMGRELTGGENGLVLYWRFEEGEDTAVNDQSSYGNDGALVVTNDGDPESPDNRWVADGHPAAVHGIWNPTHSYGKAGDYEASLKVLSDTNKWSAMVTTDVEIIDGKVAGYVRAADLRTPVRKVHLTLTSSHVTQDALGRVADADGNVSAPDPGVLQTGTDEKGYYVFEHLPLGTYRIAANKGSGDSAHEFETNVKATELTLDGPNQLAIDFVDLSVFPVGGQIIYSIQKGEGQNAVTILVEGVQVTAQPVGSTSGIEALPSTKSTNTNYSLPLFAGKYLFLAKKEGRDIRIDEDTPGYDSKTGLVTIEDARTDIDFVDYTSYELTVFVEDSGEYALSGVTVTIIGDNGQAEGQTDENDGKFVATLNPGKYTITVDGGMPKGEKEEKPAEVDLTGGNEAVTMVIPSKIELSFSPRPKLFGASPEFLEQFGLNPEDDPEGYMYYYPPKLRKHIYTITATSNGYPVEDFTLFVIDDVSMMTSDAAVEQELFVEDEEGKYTITGGYPKKTTDDPPLAAPKTVSFRATKDGYDDSDAVEDEVTVLGDVLEGTAAKIVSVPVVNYTVLHDPPGDGSYAYLDDSMSISGIVFGMKLKINDVEIPVYPSPWSKEREIRDVEFEKDPDSDTEFKDLGEKGLLGYENSDSTLGHFTWVAVLELASGAAIYTMGPIGYVFQVAKLGAKAGSLGGVGSNTGMVQYEVSPSRRLKTPSGDTLPDLLGPGKGDIYFGEGWTLGLQTKYRMGIEWNETTEQWALTTAQIETYDILERTNQYIYTPRDIENIIDDLDATINNPETTDDDEKAKLEDAKDTWQKLLDRNYAYVWARDYLREGGDNYGDSLDDFFAAQKLSTSENCETLIFSAGPTFEYSRAISESHGVSFSTGISVSSNSTYSNQSELFVGSDVWGTGTKMSWKIGSSATIGSSTSFGASWKSGVSTKQKVGFVLHDNDIGDNIATRVKADPRWGTPLFFAEPGSYTSDPWEPGTNKAVDISMELLDEPTGPFDYHDGAHYKVKLTYEGQRELESSSIGFSLYATASANTENLTFRFNGTPGSYGVTLSQKPSKKSATVVVSVYPPEVDMDNSAEKEYAVVIGVMEKADAQIGRKITRNITFVDLRAPRATITAPYSGERISPVFFPADNPFEIEVVSEDIDLKSIQLQIRSKQPDGVWEPWRNLSGMLWEDDGANENVTVFDRLDRKPPRREFTFQWAEDAISTLGVGEYALRAIAIDKATTPNTDIDPPFVVFLVDDAKPSVLNSVPDYQARESQRIYRGELSITFTDDMRATDFNDRTFYVMDLLDNNKKVSGYVSYSPALRKTVFVPIVPFRPNGFYRVEIKTDTDTDDDGTIDERGVHDLAGNPLDNAFMWTFRTTDAPFEPTWSMNWRVTDGTATDANNIVAVEYGGLDEEDEKDVRSVPALASQLRMSFLNSDKVEFDRDIRSADGRLAHHWFFVIDNAQQSATVTLEYQPSVKLTKTTRQYLVIRLVEFDQYGEVSNTINLDPTQAQTDPNTGEISFVQAYQYTNQGERSRYFRLDVQKVSFVAGKFEKGTSGWKFFSAPITPQRAEPFVNLGDDIDPFQLFQYDTALGGYKVYPYDIGEVGLQTGHGYFTRLIDDVNVDVGGSSNHDDVTLELDAAGWHAIGNPFIKEVNVASLKVNGQAFDTAVASGLVEGTLYRWNIVTENAVFLSSVAISDSYEPVTSAGYLNPWDGCWLKTNQANLTLTIPAPADLPDTPPTPDYLKPPMAPVVSGLNPKTTGQLKKDEFNLRLELTSEFASDLSTMLGTRQNAQTGWDVLDQSEPPTLSKTVAVYFDHPDWGDESGLYNRDYQPALKLGEQRTWKFTVYTDNQDAEMTLSWEKAIAQIPGDIMLYFRQDDARPDWQDMREVQSVDLISHSRITEIPFEVRAQRFEMSQLSDLQVVAGEKQVLVKWAANDNTFIDGYVIERTGQEGETSRFELPPTHSLTHLPTHEFVDTDVAEEATYTYQVTVHFKSGAELHSELFTVTVLPVIKKTVLLQSYPNPFNPDVWIPYELETEATVKIEIYNAAGQLVRTLELGMQPRGRYINRSKAAHWNGRTQVGERTASGLYFYVLKAGNFVAMKKMVILK